MPVAARRRGGSSPAGASSQRPWSGVAEQRGEAGARVEAREAAPVDRAVAADERGGLQVADQRVVLDSHGAAEGVELAAGLLDPLGGLLGVALGLLPALVRLTLLGERRRCSSSASRSRARASASALRRRRRVSARRRRFFADGPASRARRASRTRPARAPSPAARGEPPRPRCVVDGRRLERLADARRSPSRTPCRRARRGPRRRARRARRAGA